MNLEQIALASMILEGVIVGILLPASWFVARMIWLADRRLYRIELHLKLPQELGPL